MRAQKLQVVDLDGMLAPDLADDARDRIGVPGAVERDAGIVDVDPFERGGEAVRIALAADLAVGDDVEPRLLLRLDREHGRVVLRLGEIGSGMRHSSFARTRGGKRPASFARSISHSGCA